MWLYSNIDSMRSCLARTAGWILVALASVMAAGCSGGFRPMYASSDFGGQSGGLAAVDISTIPGRAGQRIRNELLFQANSGAPPVEQRYRLEVALRETTSSNLVVSDGSARSEVVNINASFQLIDIASNTPVLKGESFGRAAFERFDAAYSNVRAERDATDRAAATVARDLRSRIEAFLATEV